MNRTHQHWQSFLNEWIPNKLPGEVSHLEMFPSRKLSSEAIKEAKIVKESAVAVHLFEKDSDLQIVLTQRNTYDGVHSGQVSFPGGKKDTSDDDLVQTARRESWEEVGLQENKGQLIGQLTEVYIPVSQFRVAPFVFYHEQEIIGLRPDPREVESIFFLPGKALIDKSILKRMTIHLSKDSQLENVPCFSFENYIIWGATAIILNELKYILIENYSS